MQISITHGCQPAYFMTFVGNLKSRDTLRTRLEKTLAVQIPHKRFYKAETVGIDCVILTFTNSCISLAFDLNEINVEIGENVETVL